MKHEFPQRLETARLVLSRPAEADLPDLAALHTDPRVMATLGGLRAPDEVDAMHRRLFAFWERDGFGWWVIRLRTDGTFVGRGGLRRAQVAGRDEVELGYGLAAAFWGQGLATELATAAVRVGFEVLGLAELVSFALPTNTRSRRVMEKAGFRYERDFEYAGLPHFFYRLRRTDVTRSRPTLDLVLMPGVFAVCRLAPDAAVPAWAAGSQGFVSVTRTADELSVVCPAAGIPEDARQEAGWRCFRVAGTLDFALVGILAALVGPLAEAGVSVFAVSTFDTDYLLVKEATLARAIGALRAAGHAVQGGD